jgi:hypothetical protein
LGSPVIRAGAARASARTMTSFRAALPLAVAALAAMPAAASARPAPPYEVAKPAIERTHLSAGQHIALGATVRPLGTHPQRHLTVLFLASRDGRYDRGDGVIAKRRITVLGERPRRVRARPALKPRAGGRWHVVVCVQRGHHGRRCVDTPRTVMVTPARAGRTPPERPAPALPQAPRFLGVTDVGIDDCGDGTVSFDVGWWPAIDDSTDPDDIVYEVFQATTPGGEDFSHPTGTAPRHRLDSKTGYG